MQALVKQLQALPKADVHNHLHLSGAVELLHEYYPDVRFETPQYYDGFDGMMHFIIAHVNTLMRSSDDVVKLMDIGIRSAIKDNVKHLEASVDTGLAKYFDHSLEALIGAVGALKEKYKAEIDFRPEVGIKKTSELDEVYREGMVCIQSDVFEGIDLYGKETEQDLGGFREIFQETKARAKKTKVHIGEFSDSRSVVHVIETLEPNEIQHGISAAGSEEAIQIILDRNIRLNVCPHSNVALRAVKSLEEHPIRTLFDAGVNITINTDDLLLFHANITDQFADLIQQGLFTFEEIDEIRQNAMQGV